MQGFGTTDSIRALTAGGAQPPLVLIVEDYADCREMYAAYLTLAGFRVTKAGDGLEALSLAAASTPDLVLMDLGLPLMDGVETMQQLRANPDTRDVPVIALTAQSIAEPGRLLTAGFVAIITKPCLPDELAALVGLTILEQRRGAPA
jgi:CheY-like chemotaxis protein